MAAYPLHGQLSFKTNRKSTKNEWIVFSSGSFGCPVMLWPKKYQVCSNSRTCVTWRLWVWRCVFLSPVLWMLLEAPEPALFTGWWRQDVAGPIKASPRQVTISHPIKAHAARVPPCYLCWTEDTNSTNFPVKLSYAIDCVWRKESTMGAARKTRACRWSSGVVGIRDTRTAPAR